MKLGAPVPADDNRARFINFAGPSGTFPMTPVQDIFTPDRWNGVLNHGARFKGRVVVVGPYSEIYYKDKFATPLGPMLGVEIQANALRTWLLSDWDPRAGRRRAGRGALAAALLFTTFAVNAQFEVRRTGIRFAAALAIPFVYGIFAYGLFFPRGRVSSRDAGGLFAGAHRRRLRRVRLPSLEVREFADQGHLRHLPAPARGEPPCRDRRGAEARRRAGFRSHGLFSDVCRAFPRSPKSSRRRSSSKS